MSKYFEELKAANPIIDTARRLGLELFKSGSNEYRSYSVYEPGHNQTATVFFANTGYFWDFKAARGGDVIDLNAAVKFGGNKGEAINFLSGGKLKHYGLEYDAFMKKLNADIERWHTALRPEDIEYLMSRGLTREYIDTVRLGYSAKENRLIIPYFEGGQVVYYCGRTNGEVTKDNPKYKKALINGLNSHVIWGLHTLDRIDQPLIIAEGAFDAISFDISGFRVLSSITGPSHKDREIIREYARQEQEQGRDLYVCFDNDSGGRNFFKNLAMELISHRLSNFKRLDLPAKFKDVSELFAAGGDLKALIDTATDGVMSFANSFCPEEGETQAQNDKRHSEFKSFMLKAARFIDKAETTRIVELMIQWGYFEPKWLSEILKMATAAPLEDDIIEAILKEHDLIFDEHSGFYEYGGLNLEKTTDACIGHYISSELGRFYATGGRIASIRNNLKAKTEQKCEFDTKPIVAFLNGVLEVETGNFRPHNKEDMNLIVLKYNYDPTAHSQKWQDFLMSVAWSPTRKLQDVDGDARIAVLQEFAGYALFSDCRHDKALFVLGGGQNGKTAFLNVIKSVFGAANYSSVEVDRLNQNFQAVQLLGKLLNFTSEQSLNFSGAEATFKALTSGETISDSFKGRDTFTFSTRAKFIISANELPSASDKSFGFLRRFLFVRFKNKFVEPVKEGREPMAENNERLADTTIKAKDAFHDELPAIFNWIYAGYKRLMQKGRFTNSPDQAELEQAFAAGNNHLIDFIIDSDFARDDTFWPWKKLYQEYCPWATESGYKQLGRNMFMRNLRQALTNQKINCCETKDSDVVRGIKFNYDYSKNL